VIGSAERATTTSWRASFHGRGLSLFGIFATNLVLILVTLGLYVFWAKVRVRRFLFSETELGEDRFAFHGRGAELFLGMLKAAVIFGLPLAGLRTLPGVLGAGPVLTLTCSALASIVAAVFVPVARVGARRYRLTRTSWRGVRFGFQGGVGAFMRIFFVGWALTLLSLGIYYPVYLTRAHGFLVRHTSFGTARFDFDGDGKPLVLDFLYTLLLTLPTLGLVWFWFVARKRQYLWAHTSIRGVHFQTTVTGGRLLALVAGNVALIVGTLGLAWPWTIVRSARFHCVNLSLEGAVNLADIRQSGAMAPATGEGLLSLLDVDMGLV
jgi:uncharacterized membrane protein YjgN (DUF898 family)